MHQRSHPQFRQQAGILPSLPKTTQVLIPSSDAHAEHPEPQPATPTALDTRLSIPDQPHTHRDRDLPGSKAPLIKTCLPPGANVVKTRLVPWRHGSRLACFQAPTWLSLTCFKAQLEVGPLLRGGSQGGACGSGVQGLQHIAPA